MELIKSCLKEENSYKIFYLLNRPVLTSWTNSPFRPNSAYRFTLIWRSIFILLNYFKIDWFSSKNKLSSNSATYWQNKKLKISIKTIALILKVRLRTIVDILKQCRDNLMRKWSFFNVRLRRTIENTNKQWESTTKLIWHKSANWIPKSPVLRVEVADVDLDGTTHLPGDKKLL